MITRILYPEERSEYNRVVKHPVQTWEWGDFQISQGHKVYRLGVFDNQKIVSAYTVSFHHLPKVDYTIGTMLRGPEIDQDMLNNISKIATDEKAIFVKLEPDVYHKVYSDNSFTTLSPLPSFNNLAISPKVAFYPHSFVIDLDQTETALLESMHPKTRYNIKVANRHGVKIEEMSTDKGFEIYLDLLFHTTKRQGFYLHTVSYHRQLWNTLKKTGMAHIMLASYQGKYLSAFMLFSLKDKLFYPYGASLNEHREVMAPTLLMWECIKFGKTRGLKEFDMWGSLGPDAKEGDDGFVGFHRFKQGYGGKLYQFVGTYDLIINPMLYKVYNFIDKYRWQFLRLKAKILR